MNSRYVLCQLGVSFSLLLIAQIASAASKVDHGAVLTPFISDDTFAILNLNIASMGLPKDDGTTLVPQTFFILQSLPPNLQAQIFLADIAQTLGVRFRNAGGQSIYLLAGLGDIHIGGGPVAIATTQPGKSAADVAQFFGVTLQEIAENKSYDASIRSYVHNMRVECKGDVVLLGTKTTVARYMDFKPAIRNDLVQPLERLSGEGAIAAVVFCPGPDFRRVVRELWPELAGPLAPLRGELADRWLYLDAAINSPPDMKPRLAIHTSDPGAATLFVKLWQSLPEMVAQVGGNKGAVERAKGWARTFVNALPAKAEGTHVTISIPTEGERAAKLRDMLGAAITAANESANRRERISRLHNIALGLLNFESARKHLPPAAISDKDGRPLLSWRVAILPYLEQGELYKQFHLDEPWDSPHNRPLIKKMPGVYMGLGPEADQLNREGKTNCQVPTGPATVFYNKEGTKWRDIADGTANTILVVEVEPGRAVEWTRPADWDVDLAHPRQGVQRTDPDGFFTAFCDASVHYLTKDIDEAKLRALLTRAGHESIERP